MVKQEERGEGVVDLFNVFDKVLILLLKKNASKIQKFLF